MLPALKSNAPSLADVLQSSLAATDGAENRLGLKPVDSAIVLLVDGLGADNLRARVGHARTLGAAFTSKSVIESGFPTTTAAAITSLTTGVAPGQHGLVGYSVLDPAHDRVINQLSGWDADLDPATWQLERTIFERAAVPAFAVGPARYDDSGFSQAVLRGAKYVPAESLTERMARAAELAREPALIYVYAPELDMAAHSYGWESDRWTRALESVDAAAAALVDALPKRAGLLVTADHGIIDVPQHQHVLFDTVAGLIDGLSHIAGEPRALQLHFAPDSTAQQRSRTLALWQEHEGGRSWVVTRDEAVAAGWFGAVRPEVLPRIGDVIVAARKGIAYYDSRTANDRARAMVGQHGSWSPAEVRVPLLRFGAFA